VAALPIATEASTGGGVSPPRRLSGLAGNVLGKARLLAWADLQNDWHLRHGRHFPAAQCAGCKLPIGGHEALDMPDGNRVHLDPLDCAIAFGKGWRGAADAGLAAFGLVPPSSRAG
jgi:hypothetical protein